MLYYYNIDEKYWQNLKKVLRIACIHTIIRIEWLFPDYGNIVKYLHKSINKDWKVKMKKRVKLLKTINLLLLSFLVIQLLAPANMVQAKKSKSKNYWPKLSEEITAGAAILMDVDTGAVLYKKNIDKPYYPASITKILTTLIAVENSTMDEVVTFSQDAIYKTEGSGIARDVGEVMTMEQCLYAVMLESANECAYAVAEHISGSLEEFVKLMNQKAKSLGCKSSHFTNPHGLPDEKHYLSAKDMAVIARTAYENETFRLICGTKKYTIPPTNKHSEPTYLVNHHKMLYPKDTAAYLYDYCTGGKTGYTNAAGNTLVTYAQKDGMTLVAVILNGTSPQYWKETRALLDFGFENFNLCNVSEYFGSDENVEEQKYDTLNTNDPYAQIDPQARIILPKTVNFSKASMEISYENLPDQVLAQLIYTYGKRPVGTANIVRTHTLIDKEEGASGQNNDAAQEQTADESSTAEADSQTDKEKTESKESQDKDPEKAGQANQNGGADSKNKEPGFLEKIKKIDMIGKIKNFDIHDVVSNISNWFANIKLELSPQILIIAGGIILGIVLIIVFRVLYDKSYLIRQKMANYRNRKRARKQYTIIRDTRRTRRGKWRKR